MAEPFTTAFDRIITLCQAIFEELILVRRQERSQYAVLELRGRYNHYLIEIREILRLDGSRKYAYYIIHEGQVVAGFDNAADATALRLKYGRDYTQHRLEEIPHYHTSNKQTVELTEEMDCQKFIGWLEENL